MSSYILEIKFV